MAFAILGRFMHTRSMNAVPPTGESHNAGLEEEARELLAKQKLRALLDQTSLTPDQTSDDIAPPENKVTRDSELKRDVPPHHG